jgi:hypothetical protein
MISRIFRGVAWLPRSTRNSPPAHDREPGDYVDAMLAVYPALNRADGNRIRLLATNGGRRYARGPKQLALDHSFPLEDASGARG